MALKWSVKIDRTPYTCEYLLYLGVYLETGLFLISVSTRASSRSKTGQELVVDFLGYEKYQVRVGSEIAVHACKRA